MKKGNQYKNYCQKLKKISLKLKSKLKTKTTYSHFILDTYTLEALTNKKHFHIINPTYKKNFEYLIFTKPDAIITLGSIVSNEDELDFFHKLLKTIKKLEQHNRPYNIRISVKDYNNLKKSGLLSTIKNINLIITSNLDDYTIEEYIEIEERLNNLIKPIQESNLSPYEKYLAVYNIVKNFKPYKDNPDNPKLSRDLKYILKPDNEYIVCVGYTELFEVLLKKIGIQSTSILVRVDTSYDEGFTMECVETKLEWHRRIIVKIDDDKYQIHGIYLSDPTWDNSQKYDLYNNNAMTFDKRKEAYRLEHIGIDDLLLDFHNFEEFNEKINYYLKKELRNSTEEKIKDKIIKEYGFLYNKILHLLKKLDYSKYEYFNQKYQKQLEKTTKKKNTTLKEIENIYVDFLTEYANYIIPLSNNKISNDNMYKALSNVKKVIDGYNKEELQKWSEITNKKNVFYEQENFPYLYNPGESRINFLETKENVKSKSLIKKQ